IKSILLSNMQISVITRFVSYGIGTANIFLHLAPNVMSTYPKPKSIEEGFYPPSIPKFFIYSKTHLGPIFK
ncbi:MAG TPA: hypothetical protein VF540_07385, partial [Segetibacter sp.]